MNDVELKTHLKYLGVTIDNKLTWNAHIKEILTRLILSEDFYKEISVHVQCTVQVNKSCSLYSGLCLCHMVSLYKTKCKSS